MVKQIIWKREPVYILCFHCDKCYKFAVSMFVSLYLREKISRKATNM